MRTPSSALALLLLTLTAIASAQSTPPLRDLNTHCPFQVPLDRQAWEARAADLRLQLQVSLGLYPSLDLPKVQPEVYGQIQRDGYTIEKLVFDSLPGFKVTGSLYKPANLQPGTQVPGILCPHGHWADARFRVANDSEIREALASGGERFAAGASNHIQARCVQLARMGCVVLQWDMIGYCDSQQISIERAHGFKDQPADIEKTADGWLLYSPLAEAHLQSTLGLQALATRRAVDVLLSMDFVDADRLAITGASGGGTQSFIGAALDERIAVAFPAVMVSTGMQGGCTCENCSLLRIGSGNVEMAALIAPRPLGLTAANDWTRTMPDDGFPELRELYGLLGAKKQVQLFPAVHFGHNFNHVSRVAMYGWMNQHLKLGLDEPILEQDFELASSQELSVWDAQHPAPAGGLDFERQLLQAWGQRLDSHFDELSSPGNESELADTLRQGWRVCLGMTTSPLKVAVSQESGPKAPLRLSSPSDASWSLKRVVESPATGVTLRVGSDSAAQKYHFSGVGQTPQPLVDNPRLAAAYTYGYNLPHFAQQARRLASSLAYLLGEQAKQSTASEISLTASGADAALAAAAVLCWQDAFPGDQRIRLELKPDNFQFASAESIRSPSFLPGSSTFRDFDGLLGSLRNTQVVISGKAAAFPIAERLAKHNASPVIVSPDH